MVEENYSCRVKTTWLHSGHWWVIQISQFLGDSPYEEIEIWLS